MLQFSLFLAIGRFDVLHMNRSDGFVVHRLLFFLLHVGFEPGTFSVLKECSTTELQELVKGKVLDHY